jgi:hypothetical protein
MKVGSEVVIPVRYYPMCNCGARFSYKRSVTRGMGSDDPCTTYEWICEACGEEFSTEVHYPDVQYETFENVPKEALQAFIRECFPRQFTYECKLCHKRFPIKKGIDTNVCFPCLKLQYDKEANPKPAISVNGERIEP